MMNTIIKIIKAVQCPGGKIKYIANVETTDKPWLFPFIPHPLYPNVYLSVSVREALYSAIFVSQGDSILVVDDCGNDLGTVLLLHSAPPSNEEEMYE